MGARDFAPRVNTGRHRAAAALRSPRLANDSVEPPFRRGHRDAAERRRHAAAHRSGRPRKVAKGAGASRIRVCSGAAMNQSWGRSGAAGTWPHPKPVWTLALLLLSVASIGTVSCYQDVTAWTSLQRAYLPVYARAWLMQRLGIA